MVWNGLSRLWGFLWGEVRLRRFGHGLEFLSRSFGQSVVGIPCSIELPRGSIPLATVICRTVLLVSLAYRFPAASESFELRCTRACIHRSSTLERDGWA